MTVLGLGRTKGGSYYAYCDEEGCKRPTYHSSGKCPDHNKRKCFKFGCGAIFTPKQMKSKYCPNHREPKSR